MIMTSVIEEVEQGCPQSHLARAIMNNDLRRAVKYMTQEGIKPEDMVDTVAKLYTEVELLTGIEIKDAYLSSDRSMIDLHTMDGCTIRIATNCNNGCATFLSVKEITKEE